MKIRGLSKANTSLLSPILFVPHNPLSPSDVASASSFVGSKVMSSSQQMPVKSRFGVRSYLQHFKSTLLGRIAISFIVLGTPALAQAEQDVDPNASSSAVNSAPSYVHKVVPFTVEHSDEYHIVRRYSGNLVASQNADLGFELAGKLDQVFKKAGESVTKGETVAALNVELLRIEKQQQAAQLEETRARLALTEASIRRQRSLREKGFTSEQRLDELEAERKAYQAGLQRIEASMDGVETRIRKSHLIAPYDGVVTRRFVDEGTVVNAGTRVMRLQQAGSMELEVGVPARLAANMQVGDDYKITLQGHPATAKLVSLGADVDNMTRTVQARFDLNGAQVGYHGSLVKVEIAEPVPAEGFWLPAAAITDGVRGLWVAYVMQPQNNGLYKLEARDVQILHATNESVYVSGAISDGEKVVSQGLLRLVAGQWVRNGIAQKGSRK
ncbi:Multidrug resistance protein MdtA [BD1-7 clade bacterium]|uniref:Multidrug resistance protein MdtA n=1 Tax=BD1-7 clade bacterium TaxID=2029982 RepID=A0A5S9QSC4_9GAMM|nr:Multidrug resistance protein MdtA [BD1-7 clade bacterium]